MKQVDITQHSLSLFIKEVMSIDYDISQIATGGARIDFKKDFCIRRFSPLNIEVGDTVFIKFDEHTTRTGLEIDVAMRYIVREHDSLLLQCHLINNYVEFKK